MELETSASKLLIDVSQPLAGQGLTIVLLRPYTFYNAVCSASFFSV